MITALQLQIVFIAPQEEWEVFFSIFYLLYYISRRFFFYIIYCCYGSPAVGGFLLINCIIHYVIN
jgi:hypothetical protein